MRTALFLMMIFPLLVGCRRPTDAVVTSHDKHPKISVPDRPSFQKMTPEELAEYMKLPEPVRQKLQGNNEKLQIFADQCFESIREYNSYAKIQNSLNDAWVNGGMKTEPAAPGK